MRIRNSPLYCVMDSVPGMPPVRGKAETLGEIESGDLLYIEMIFSVGKGQRLRCAFSHLFAYLRYSFVRGEAMDIEIISGFLGAGKTTFLNKYLPALSGKTVVIENEFGEIGLDGDLIRTDVPVREIYAGCICCSLSADFRNGIREIAEQFHPDRIVIEPSGVGKLSDIIKVCEKVRDKDGIDIRIRRKIVVLDGGSYEEYIDGFGAFYLDQIQHAQIIFCGQVEDVPEEKKTWIMEDIRKKNPKAILYEGDFRKLEETELQRLLEIAEKEATEQTGAEQDNGGQENLQKETFANMTSVAEGFTFSSISLRNIPRMTRAEIEELADDLKDRRYGRILRAKGILETVEEEIDVTLFHAGLQPTEDGKESRVIIIGSGLNRPALEERFQVREPLRLPKRPGVQKLL